MLDTSFIEITGNAFPITPPTNTNRARFAILATVY